MCPMPLAASPHRFKNRCYPHLVAQLIYQTRPSRRFVDLPADAPCRSVQYETVRHRLVWRQKMVALSEKSRIQRFWWFQNSHELKKWVRRHKNRLPRAYSLLAT